MQAAPKMKRRNRMLTWIWIVWMLAGLFGDEVVGLALFGWESDALSLSMAQSWWWNYQLVLLLVFPPILTGVYFWSRRTRIAGDDD